MKEYIAMRNRMIVLCGFTCVAATVSIALGQASICFKYGSLGSTQTGTQNCNSYTVCPDGYRCLNGRSDKKVGNPFNSTVPCEDFINGTGTAPNCTGGTSFGSSSQVTVVDQKCSGGCMSGPPA